MRVRFEKSSVFLVMIIALCVGLGIAYWASLLSDEVTDAIRDDRIIKVLFVLEENGKPVSSEVLIHYPVTHRSAIIDIPPETGQIIKRTGKMARIDTEYDPGDLSPFREEVERLMDTEIPWFVKLDMARFEKMVDLLGGISVFIPNSVDLRTTAGRVLLPSGAVTLDGAKAVTFLTYADPAEQEIERVTRRQKSMQSFFSRMGSQSKELVRNEVFPGFSGFLMTNLPDRALKNILGEFRVIDFDRIAPQRVGGSKKDVDGIVTLFPAFNGELLKDMVKQTLNALANSATSTAEARIYTVEVLNGTSIKGLGKKTQDLLMSFGYDVLSVGNADTSDVEKTVIYDRQNSRDAAADFAKVIRCGNVTAGVPLSGQDAAVDFTILLGKDFNGRYVIK